MMDAQDASAQMAAIRGSNERLDKTVPTDIYHITHVDNLATIIDQEDLCSDADRIRRGFASVNIAHGSLKNRREKVAVPIAAGGVIADYVPFYFANRSPMLYAIHSGFVDGFDGKQDDVIYLVSTAERVASENQEWCFTDGHAVVAISKFFKDLVELRNVDWEVIRDWSWRDTEDDPDRKRRKQAEFLIYQTCPWAWIDRIGVINAAMARRIQKMIQRAVHKPQIVINKEWYY